MKQFTYLLLLVGVIYTQAQQAENNITVGNRFSSVELKGDMTVVLQENDGDKTRIVGEQEDINQIRIKQKKGRIIISKDLNFRKKDTRNVTVYLPYSSFLSQVILSGSGNISSEQILESDDEIKLTLSGSGNVSLATVSPLLNAAVSGSGKLEVEADVSAETNIVLSGSGQIKLSGRSPEAKIRLSGSGRIVAKDYRIDIADIFISGSGNVAINAKKIRKQTIVGSGTVDRESL